MLNLDTIKQRCQDMITLCRSDLTLKISRLGSDSITGENVFEAARSPMLSLTEMASCDDPRMNEMVKILTDRRESLVVSEHLLESVRKMQPELVGELREACAAALIMESSRNEGGPTVMTTMETLLCGCIIGILVGHAEARLATEVANN